RRLARGRPLTPDLLADAVWAATREAEGTYAIAVLHAQLPGHLFGARRGSPLVVGVGEGENFLASDVSPIVGHTRKVIYLHDGDMVAFTVGVFWVTAGGQRVRRAVSAVHGSAEAAERGKFPHYMLKEIHEHPHRVAEVLRQALNPTTGTATFQEPALDRKGL